MHNEVDSFWFLLSRTVPFNEIIRIVYQNIFVFNQVIIWFESHCAHFAEYEVYPPPTIYCIDKAVHILPDWSGNK